MDKVVLKYDRMSEVVRLVLWDERPTKELPNGVRRRVFSTDKVMVVQYLYEPGAIFPVHRHPQDQMVMVEEGVIEFSVGGVSYTLGPGHLLSIPGDVPHGARVIGDDPVRSVNIFHPVKEEFLHEAG